MTSAIYIHIIRISIILYMPRLIAQMGICSSIPDVLLINYQQQAKWTLDGNGNGKGNGISYLCICVCVCVCIHISFTTISSLGKCAELVRIGKLQWQLMAEGLFDKGCPTIQSIYISGCLARLMNVVCCHRKRGRGWDSH